jgi:hypothetical protein
VSIFPKTKHDPYRAYEYIIKDQSNIYIVPHEQFDENGLIQKEEIEKWQVNPSDYLAEKM